MAWAEGKTGERGKKVGVGLGLRVGAEKRIGQDRMLAQIWNLFGNPFNPVESGRVGTAARAWWIRQLLKKISDRYCGDCRLLPVCPDSTGLG